MKLIIEIDLGTVPVQRYSQIRSIIKDALGKSDHRAEPQKGESGAFYGMGSRVGRWYVTDGK